MVDFPEPVVQSGRWSGRLGSKADIMQYIFLSAGIAERHVTEFDSPLEWLAELPWFLWIFDNGSVSRTSATDRQIPLLLAA